MLGITLLICRRMEITRISSAFRRNKARIHFAHFSNVCSLETGLVWYLRFELFIWDMCLTHMNYFKVKNSKFCRFNTDFRMKLSFNNDNLTLRKQAYSNILKILPPKKKKKKKWKISVKNSDIFLISAQNRLWYSLEPPRRGGSNQYLQSMF